MLAQRSLNLKILALLLVFFWLAPLSVWAQSVGTIVLEKGMLKIRRDQKDQIVKETGKPIQIFNKDSIQTGKDSSAKIKFTDKDDAVELFSQSFFQVGAVTAAASETRLSTGKARFMVKPGLKARRPGSRRFRVRTSNAIIGVKGTDFVLSTGAEETKILTLTGVVGIANLAEPTVEVDVGANQASKIQKASRPTAPSKVPPDVAKKVATVDSPKVWNEVKFGEVVKPTTEGGQKKKSKKKDDGQDKKSDSKSEKKNGNGGSKAQPKAQASTSGPAPGGGSVSAGDSNEPIAAESDQPQGLEGSEPITEGADAELDAPAALESNLDAPEALEPDLDAPAGIELDTVDIEETEFDETEIEVEEPVIELETDELVDKEAIQEVVDQVEEQVDQIEEQVTETKTIKIKITH